MDTELKFIPEDAIINLEPYKPNIELYMGDGRDTDNKPSAVWGFYAKKTLINRFKYWMLCKFFPFKIKRWE